MEEYIIIHSLGFKSLPLESLYTNKRQPNDVLSQQISIYSTNVVVCLHLYSTFTYFRQFQTNECFFFTSVILLLSLFPRHLLYMNCNTTSTMHDDEHK